MIQSTELRLGNLLQSGKGIYKVISISLHESLMEIITISDDGFVIPYPTIYKPIPITEEWLLKLGFSIEDNESYQLDTDLGFCIWGRIGQSFNVYVNSDSIGNEKEYVHELQNLYFALTGKELEYVGKD